MDEPRAIRHVRAVAFVLREKVTAGEMDADVVHLKPEYEELF